MKKNKISNKKIKVNLSKELRKQFKTRNTRIRKGDLVRVMRGKFKKREGKVVQINPKYIYIEGLQRTKKDGSKINVPFHPTNLQIKELNMEDKKRKIK